MIIQRNWQVRSETCDGERRVDFGLLGKGFDAVVEVHAKEQTSLDQMLNPADHVHTRIYVSIIVGLQENEPPIQLVVSFDSHYQK